MAGNATLEPFCSSPSSGDLPTRMRDFGPEYIAAWAWTVNRKSVSRIPRDLKWSKQEVCANGSETGGVNSADVNVYLEYEKFRPV